MRLLMKNHQAGFTLIEYIVALVIAAIMAALVSTYFGTALTQSGVPILRFQKASNLHAVMENIVADFNRLNALNLRWKWRSGTVYTINSIVVPKTTNNGHYYKCTTAGTSGANEPGTGGTLPWPTTTGETVVDGGVGGVTWTESGRVWQPALVSYTTGTIVVPTTSKNNGHYYKCTTAGTSGATEPTWLTTTGGTVVDGDVTWTEVGTILDRSDAALTNIKNYLTNNPDRYGTGYTVTEQVFIRFDPDSSPPNQEDTTAVTEQNTLKVTIKSNDTNETLTQLFTIR